MTEPDGSFRAVAARNAEFDVYALLPDPDGRLVPGRTLGRCRGGARDVILRVPR